ncbi:MAG: hypothetical protein NTV80_16285 [Verrucomicrobia bacterium]|nr:hypothetical protein [Verrucomicrobiota bacterium]
MPLAFSFFSHKTAALPVKPQAEDGAGIKWTPDVKVNESAFNAGIQSPADSYSPSSWDRADAPSSLKGDEETHIIENNPVQSRKEISLPARREATGFAAMVVNQSENAAPPLNRRPNTPFPIAPEKINEALFPGAPVMTSHETWHAAEPQASETSSYESIKEELQHEIEQVKADLFGAAMGVSALKDRLDGMESTVAHQVSSAANSPLSRQEMQAWMAEWLDQNLPTALERAISQAQQKMTGSLSTQDFFRQPVRFAPADRSTALIHPPIILASTPL